MSRSLSAPNLRPQELLFLTVLTELGGGSQSGGEAALRAGYADTYEDAERAARILLESPRITRALKEMIMQRFDVAVSAAYATILSICVNGRSETARLSAAQEILNRGVGPVPSRSVSVTARTTVEDLIDSLDARERTAARRGTGASGGVIDVTAVSDTEESEDAA